MAMRIRFNPLLPLATLLTLAPTALFAFEYPTVDRVEYVQGCQRDNADHPAHEMLYKCSCVIDGIAKEMAYDDYVESSTAFYASSIAGERGQVIRNESISKGLADQFKALQAKAKKGCFVN